MLLLQLNMAPKKDKVPPPSSKLAKSGGGKHKKKKWSKGKQKDGVNNMVLFDQATYDKLLTEAPMFKLITPFIFSDRMRCLRVEPCNVNVVEPCSINIVEPCSVKEFDHGVL
ncbi:unnamed protein product [Eruca vesicaria subsp. sativa]|uniref:40S ribosomal protein S25 n=1 Tax=Eruca vesicaria subsp. sativa TaxID=29727 RepID=A0ABC8IZT6_ERUVS|nr:unnamed protein product [Eruca vesicaria subsp. sativa]